MVNRRTQNTFIFRFTNSFTTDSSNPEQRCWTLIRWSSVVNFTRADIAWISYHPWSRPTTNSWIAAEMLVMRSRGENCAQRSRTASNVGVRSRHPGSGEDGAPYSQWTERWCWAKKLSLRSTTREPEDISFLLKNKQFTITLDRADDFETIFTVIRVIQTVRSK